MNLSTTKQDLRQQLRRERRALSPRQQQLAATACPNQLRQWDGWLRASRIACYIAADGELDPAPCVEMARAAGKQVYLPVVEGKQLRFAHWNADDTLRKGEYGILEPPHDAPRIEVCDLDLVLLPLVGFDRGGARLGMGGGFYDRCLQRQDSCSSRPALIGLAHALQEVSSIPTEPWDVALDAVITERELVLTVSGSQL